MEITGVPRTSGKVVNYLLQIVASQMFGRHEK